MPNITPTFQLKDATITISAATTAKITNLAIGTPNSEVSHVLQDNLKQLIIRQREIGKIQYCFTSGQSGTTYMTIPRGCTEHLADLTFSSKTLYLQSDKTGTIEIMELY